MCVFYIGTMNISPVNFNISFGKKLTAKAAVIENREKLPCRIYKLSTEKDADYFEEIRNAEDWKSAEFIKPLKNILSDISEYEEFYALEDKNDNCLGVICLVENKKTKRKSVSYIETCPKDAYENTERNIKYVGETLLSFVTALAKKDKSRLLSIPVALQSAEAFYTEKCGFINRGIAGMTLFPEQYENLLKQNEEHTKSKIKFVI